MEVVIVVFVVIGALFAIGSGVWVAIALVRAISSHQEPTEPEFQTDQTNRSLQKNNEEQADKIND